MIAEIEACIPALRRYAMALLRNRQEVDDLVHDCLVRAIDRWRGHRAEPEPRIWLFTTLHRDCVDRLRRPRRQVISDPSAVMESALIPSLEALPLEQRCLLLLVSVGDLTYAEAARVIGLTIDAVVPLLSRAREALHLGTTADPSPALRRVP